MTGNERFHEALLLGISHARGRPIGACLRQLREWQRLDAPSYEQMRAARLAQALDHAKRTVPLYCSADWERADVRSLQSWPILTRQHIQAHARSLRSQTINKHYYRSTSGSTGQALSVGFDGEAGAWGWAVEYFGLGWHGIGIGDRSLKLAQKPESRFTHWVRNMDFWWVADMSPRRCAEMVELMRKTRPRYVWGYVSALVEFARHARGCGHPVPYAKVYGERLFPAQRAEIEEGLRTRVLETYGCNETGTVAHECPAGSLHVFAEHVEIEVVNGEQPVAPGETGEILLTSLTNRAMPLIRYRVGDRGRLSPDPCSCGRNYPVIAGIEGRVGDVLYAADGGRVHGAVLGEMLKEISRTGSVGRVFFDQHDRRTWTVLVEPREGYNGGSATFLADSVRRIFGQECSVDVKCVAQIPREKSGKFRYYRAAPAAASSLPSGCGSS